MGERAVEPSYYVLLGFLMPGNGEIFWAAIKLYKLIVDRVTPAPRAVPCLTK